MTVMTEGPIYNKLLGSPIPLARTEEWAPRPQVAPEFLKSSNKLSLRSNGSAGCYGGWELFYSASHQTYFLFKVNVRWKGLQNSFDSVSAEADWVGAMGWSPILNWTSNGEWVTLWHVLKKPPGASELSIKLLLRWSASGVIEWQKPELIPVAPPSPRKIRLGAGSIATYPRPQDMAENIRNLLQVARQAGDAGVKLLCLPEVALSWRLPIDPTNPYANAVTVPGPELESFQKLAQRLAMAICFSIKEKRGELLHNTAVLIDERGEISGTYRKVHLAPPSESWNGITPGNEFGVFSIQTGQARVGMNICMDSSVEESARAVARQGAEIVLLPIMGDHRATAYWEPVPHQFDLERWKMIHKVRAMDNQVFMVVARNQGIGTGIFAPDGTTLALDEGGLPLVHAEVDMNKLQRVEATFKDKCWFTRRESLYGSLSGDLLPTVKTW